MQLHEQSSALGNFQSPALPQALWLGIFCGDTKKKQEPASELYKDLGLSSTGDWQGLAALRHRVLVT
jgi:hypothetical protein